MRPSLVRGAPGLASPSQTTGWRLDTHNDLADLSLLKSPFVHSRVAQLVEQPAVNRLVAGSSPASGAKTPQGIALRGFVFLGGCGAQRQVLVGPIWLRTVGA